MLKFKCEINDHQNKKYSKKHRLLFLIFNLILFFQISSNCFASGIEKVVPMGKTIGMNMKVKHPIIADYSNILVDNERLSPAKNAGIKIGDKIKKINGNVVNDKFDAQKALENCGGNQIKLLIERNKKELELKITPKLCSETEKYKLGIWINDYISGLGTMTFYDPETKIFASLGHGMCENEGDNLIEVSSGDLHDVKVSGVEKSIKKIPGELSGFFSTAGFKIGSLGQNTAFGVYGTIHSSEFLEFYKNKEVEIATPAEIKRGKAQILTNIDGDKVDRFNIEIEKTCQDKKTKSIYIKVTDENLVNQTGGIVRGMSGSPILQIGVDGSEKLVGALTHVTTNDPTKGYGIFATTMVKECESLRTTG